MLGKQSKFGLAVVVDSVARAMAGGGGVNPHPINPARNTNPANTGEVWTNTTTGEMFVCTDNTPDDNIWQGQLGSVIWDSKSSYDPFKDGSGVAYYRFENTANDEHGLYNGSWHDIGEYGTADGLDGAYARFPDSTNWVSLGDVLDSLFMSGNFTLSIWWWLPDQLNSTGENQMIASKWHSSTYTDNCFILYPTVYGSGNGGIGDFSFFTDAMKSKWNNTIITSKNHETDMYVNGVLKASGNTVSNDTSRPLFFNGFDVNAHYRMTNGRLDGIRFLNKGINASQANTLFHEFD